MSAEVTVINIDGTVSRDVTEATVVSSGGPRGPQGPQGDTGPQGASVTVHWSTVPPNPGDGNVGDIWVVV
jgi:hypothetical protein